MESPKKPPSLVERLIAARDQVKASIEKDGLIELGIVREHEKASEVYIDVIFRYPAYGEEWHGSIPIIYPRQGVFVKDGRGFSAVVKKAYDCMEPGKRDFWVEEQKKYWNAKRAKVTEPMFWAMKDSHWKCVECDLMGRNKNYASRIRDIKNMGYTVASNPNRLCPKCGKRGNHHLLLRLPRGNVWKYETISPRMKKRITSVLGSRDAYDRTGTHLLPDHKFPEARWDGENVDKIDDSLTDTDIRRKFQLLSNQRNEQKREVCRECYRTGERGTLFDIDFYYRGGKKWPEGIPKKGREAEKGCVGCGWYDMEAWREALKKRLKG